MEEVNNQAYQQAESNYAQHAYDRGALDNNFLAQLVGMDARYSSLENLYASQMQNSFNSAEAAKNRNWEEYMSNTANQRAVKDLKEAGFSPLALLGNTSSASTPGGGSASSGSGGGGSGSKSGQIMAGILRSIVSLGMASASLKAAKLGFEGRRLQALATAYSHRR